MAKKKTDIGEVGGSIFELLKKVDDSVDILSESDCKVSEWIPTGNYILNACLSGSLRKGIANTKTYGLSGESGAGKSFLQLSICREAQKLGYTPVIMDSEGSIDSDFVSRIGCDPSRMIIKQVNTINECSQFILSLIELLKKQEESSGEHDKLILVLDSLGNLTSDKERNDLLSGDNKRDMTKQQELKALFRVVTSPLSRLHVPFIITSHVYASIGSYVPTNVMSGGTGLKYAASIILELSAKKLEDKENDKKATEKSQASSQTRNGVLVTAKPTKSRFCIPRKVSFQIPFFKEPNPYVGLEEYLNWENAGVCRGNCLTAKEYEKSSVTDKAKCLPFEYNGETMYCLPKDTARGMVIKHLGCQVSFMEFFSDKVFTPEYIDQIDETVIRPLFELPSRNSFDDVKELEETLGVDEDGSEE